MTDPVPPLQPSPLAGLGWGLLAAAGRHADVADGQLEGFIAQLGQQAALAVATRREAIPRG